MPPPITPRSSGAVQTDAQVLQAAEALWREGHYEQARQTVQSAIDAASPPGAALRTAAWAYGDAFRLPLHGRRVTLVRRSSRDVALVRSAWSDRSFMQRFHRMAAALPPEDADLAAMLDREQQATLLDSRHLHWTVVAERPVPRRIGMVSLVDVSVRHGRAELIVGVLDPKPGLALEASLLAVEFAFSTLGVHKLCSSIYGSNAYALRSTLHLGFQKEGTLRDHVRDPATNESVSLHLSALFRPDFASPANQRLAQRLLGRALAP